MGMTRGATFVYCTRVLPNEWANYLSTPVQKLSDAYNTLYNPNTRHVYDVYGTVSDNDSEVTFREALRDVAKEFMEGKFDTIINLLDLFQCIGIDLDKNTVR